MLNSLENIVDRGVNTINRKHFSRSFKNSRRIALFEYITGSTLFLLHLGRYDSG